MSRPRLNARKGRTRSRWSRRVIIELELFPDQSRQINHLPAGRSFGEGHLSFVAATVPELAAAARRLRMDERDVRGIRNSMKRWAQHFLPHLAVAAVDVLDVDVDATFWALEASEAAQSEPEWSDVVTGFS